MYRSPSPNTRLLDAAWAGNLEQVEWALAHSARPNARLRTAHNKGHKGQTALHRTVHNTDMDLNGQAAIVARLLGAGANPNLVDAAGRSPADLLFSTYADHVIARLLPLLLDHGMSLAGGQGPTLDAPVFQCIRWLSPHNRLDEVLAHGGSLAQRNKQGDTPLLALVRSLSRTSPMGDRLDALLERNAEVNAVSELDGGSPLTVLVTTLADDPTSSAVPDAVRRLLTAGADPNHGQKLLTTSRFGGRATHASPDPSKLERPLANGYTALHLAAWYGSLDICEALLNAGASPTARTQGAGLPCTVSALERLEPGSTGFTPRELAQINGHETLAVRLEGAELATEMHAAPWREMPSRPRERL